MRWVAPALLALCSLLAACSSRDPASNAELADFDDSLERLQSGIRATMSQHPGSGEPDFRGRTFQEDMTEWVMAEPTRQTLRELRENSATASNRRKAAESLGVARRMLSREFERSQGINDYWFKRLPAPHWRRHWNLVFAANQLPVDPPDPQLLAIEARMGASLEQGEFRIAAHQAKEMQAELGEALNRAAGRLVKSVRSAPKFLPRKTPCTQGGAPHPASTAAKIERSEDLESFYPSDAKRRGEQGSLVLRVRVDEKGCGTQVAVVVRSGFESIDAAALQWFETAKFSPGSRAGRPIVSDLVFKIRFKIANERSRAK